MYIYVCMYVCMHIHIYTYIQKCSFLNQFFLKIYLLQKFAGYEINLLHRCGVRKILKSACVFRALPYVDCHQALLFLG